MAEHLFRDRRNREEPEPQAPEPVADVEELRRQVQEAKDHSLRVVAEADNIKKRLQREKDEFAKYAAEGVVEALLPIVDSLDQAVVAVDKQSDPQAVIKGVHLIYRQLLGLLEKEGVTRIPTIGEPFDPHRHEAVAQVEAARDQADGVIVEEVRPGYVMNGKVLRPAMVKVAQRVPPTTDNV